MLLRWRLTFRKLSAQIAAVELLAVYPILFTLVGFVDTRVLLAVAVALAAAKLVASAVNQSRVATYDPTNFTLTPIDPHGDVNE